MNKILKNKLLLSIVIGGIVFFTGILVFSLTTLASEMFIDKGYVLNSTDKTNNVAFFDKDTKLNKKYPEQYSFKNIDNDPVLIPESTFIHYDNSLGTLKNGVLLNLDNIDQNPINYYSTSSDTLLKKNNSNYELDLNAENKENIKQGIWKISDNKYIIVSPTINATFGENRESIKDYAELEYVEGGIVNLSNDSVSLKTITSNALLELDNGIKIDLSSKDIAKNNETKLNLTKMVINSNDNIEILPNIDEVTNESDVIAKEDKTVKDGTNNTNNDSTSSNTPNGQGASNNPNGSTKINGLSGVTDGINQFFKDLINVKNQADNEKEEANATIPSFILSNFIIDSIGVKATINIVDTDSLLVGGSKVLIYEKNNNKLIYETNINQGNFKADVSTNTLSPDTEYIFKVQAVYEYQGVKYSNDFIQRNFATNSIGIKYDVNTVKEDSVVVNVKLENTSLLSSGDLVLLNNKGEKVDEANLSMETAKQDGGLNVVFDGLAINTDYKLKLENLLYNNVTSVFLNEEPRTFKTLKSPLKFGDLIVGVDKINSAFNFSIRELSDLNKGIQTINFEIFAPDNLEDVLYSIESKDPNIKVDFEDTKLSRNTFYVVKAKILFNNNLVNVTYETGYSNPFSLEGNKFPTVDYRITPNVTNNSYNGVFEVNTNGSIITGNKIKYIVQNSVKEVVANEEVNVIISDGKGEFNIDLTGLRSSDTHTIEFYADVDILDGNLPIKNTLIGGVTFNTLKSIPFKSEFDLDDQFSDAFKITTQLTSNSVEETNLSVHQMKTLKNVNFKLYKSTKDEVITEDFVPSGTLISKYEMFSKIPDWGKSTLEDEIYNNPVKLTQKDFNFTNNDIQQPTIDGVVNPNYSKFYIVEAEFSEDQSPVPNQIGFNRETKYFKFQPNVLIPEIDENNAFDITTVTNAQLGASKNTNLDDNTIVSYTVRPKFNNESGILSKITTSVYRKEGANLVNLPSLTRSTNYTPTDELISSYSYDLSNGIEAGAPPANDKMTRGEEYYITFVAEIDRNQDGVVDTIIPDKPNVLYKSTLLSPNRNDVRFGNYVTTNADQTVLNYYYSDIDNAVQSKTIKVNDTIYNLGAKDTANKISFLNATNSVTAIVRNVSNPTTFKDVEVLKNTYTPSNLGSVSYTLENSNNNIVVKLANNTQKNKIISYNIIINERSGANRTVITDIFELNNQLIIPLTRLNAYTGKEIEVNVEAVYDTGLGMDADKYTYKVLNSENFILYEADAPKIGRGEAFVLKTPVVTWLSYNQIRIDGKNYLNAASSYTLSLEKGYVTQANLKSSLNKVSTFSVPSANKFINIDAILPTVDVIDFVPLLDGFKVTYKSDDSKSDKFINNKIYLNFTKPGTTTPIIKEIPRGTNNETKEFTISGLDPDQDYDVFASVDLAGVPAPSPVYSLLNNRVKFIYRARTLGTVTDVKVDYVLKTNSNSDKGIEFTINTANSEGVNLVKYSLYDSSNNLIDYAIANDAKISTSYKKYIAFNKEKNFLPNNTYKLKIEFFLERVGSPLVDVGKFDKSFTVNLLSPPSFTMNYRATNNSIDFRSTVVDNNYTVVGGKYRIRVQGPTGNNIDVNNVTNIDHNISDVNKNMVIGGLDPSTKYKVIYSANADLGYNGSTRVVDREFEITTNNNLNINIGSVFPVVDNKKVTLQFIDSSNINGITDVSYTIFDTKGTLVNSNTMKFKAIGNDAFSTFQIPYEFVIVGGYRIELEFYKDGEEVARSSQSIYVSPPRSLSQAIRNVFGG